MATATIAPDQNTILAEVFIAAPPERVFEAISDPHQRQQWWGQKGLYQLTDSGSDLRLGGKWWSAGMGKDGKSFRVEGEYMEIDPPRRLVYSWLPDWSHPLHTVVHWELEPREVHGLQNRGPRKVGTGTVVKVRHEGFAGHVEAAAGHQQGWIRVLGWMQAFVERGETVETRDPVSA